MLLPPVHILSQIWNGAHAGMSFPTKKQNYRGYILNAEKFEVMYNAKVFVGSFIAYLKLHYVMCRYQLHL